MTAVGRGRILIIAPQPFYRPRGTPMNVRRFAGALVELGFGVDILAYPFGEDIGIPGARIIRSKKPWFITDVGIGPSAAKLPLDFMLFFAAWHLAREENYRWLHGVEEGAWIAALAGYLTGTKHVVDMDSFMPEQIKESKLPFRNIAAELVKRIDVWSVRRASAVVPVCKKIADHALDYLACGCNSPDIGKNIFLIEDIPIQLEAPADLAERVKSARARYGLEGKKAAVYTGNLESYQGIELLLESARILESSLPDARVLIVGGSPEQVEKYKAVSGGNVIFAGQQPPEEMVVFYAAADALVSPRSAGINTPLKIYTYMSTGVPVVATRMTTHTQVLDDNSAVLVSPDPASFADGLSRVLTDHAMGARLAKTARGIIAENYTYSKFKAKIGFLADYMDSLGSAKPTPE